MKHILDNLDADGINVRVDSKDDVRRLLKAMREKGWCASNDHIERYTHIIDNHVYVYTFTDGTKKRWGLWPFAVDSHKTVHINQLLGLPDTFHIPTDELTVEQKKHILQILEDNTDILWSGDTKPTEFNESIEDWRVLTFNILGNGTLTWGRVFEFFRGTRITYHELCEMYGETPTEKYKDRWGGCSKKDYPLMYYDTTKKALTIEDMSYCSPESAITKMRDKQSLMTKAINTFKKLTRSKETKAEIQAGLRHEDGKLNYQEVCPFVVEYLYETDETFRKRIQEAADIINEDKE